MMTSNKWVNELITLADSPSTYINRYPYNLLYWTGEWWSADCVNLLKALFNGRDINNKTIGSYQSNLSQTGDCTEWGLMQQCTDVSTNFAKLDNKPRVLYKSGHIGTYLGREVVRNGNIYNVVECTAWTGDWNHTGIIFTYVDNRGQRYSHKGGTWNRNAWTHHGLATKWVQYTQEKEEDEDMTYQEKWFIESGKQDITLKRGCGYADFVRNLQGYLNYFGYYDGYIDGDFGAMTEESVKAWQKANGLYIDGIIGANSWEVILRGES